MEFQNALNAYLAIYDTTRKNAIETAQAYEAAKSLPGLEDAQDLL